MGDENNGHGYAAGVERWVLEFTSAFLDWELACLFGVVLMLWFMRVLLLIWARSVGVSWKQLYWNHLETLHTEESFIIDFQL